MRTVSSRRAIPRPFPGGCAPERGRRINKCIYDAAAVLQGGPKSKLSILSEYVKIGGK